MHPPLRHALRHLDAFALLATSLAIALAVGLVLSPMFGLLLLPARAALADGIVLPQPGCFAPPAPVAQEAPPGVRLPVRPPVVVEPVRPIVPCWLTIRYHRVQVEIAD